MLSSWVSRAVLSRTAAGSVRSLPFSSALVWNHSGSSRACSTKAAVTGTFNKATPSLSYVHGASYVPLIGTTLGARFDEACESFYNRDGLIVPFQNVRWTYAQIREKVDILATELINLGLVPGDRIGIWAPNCSEWFLVQFATAKAGLVLVNVNPAYRVSELSHALSKVGCKALVLAPRIKGSDSVAMLQQVCPELQTSKPGELSSQALPFLKIVIRLGDDKSPGMFNFNDLTRRSALSTAATLESVTKRLQFDDPINIQFTSGTTGLPKGATLSHHNILNNGFFVGEQMKLTSHDALCIPVPLYHCFGMVMGNIAAVTHGSCLVYPSESFCPVSCMAAVDAYQCTALYGVPTMFIAMLDHPSFASHSFASLRTGIMAGSPCPAEVMRRCVDLMNLKGMTIAYGMTETSPVSFQSGLHDEFERRVSTVGRIVPHVEVKVVDQDGRLVPRGAPGELLTRGYSVMLGYWGDDANTKAAVDSNGWMHTGDLGVLDEEGFCKIVGRLKDMIIRGGENVYPREIEEFLYKHPKVQDVQVFGVPDRKYGEQVCAWVKVREGMSLDATELLAFCDGNIAKYKLPKHFRFVSEFPMTVTGKIQKFLMRQEMIKLLSLQEEPH